MKKVLTIITGCPGSGKTFLAKRICEQFPEIMLMSYDTSKEEYFDRYGFNNSREKEKLNSASLEEFYRRLDSEMQSGKALIIEYPFSVKHRDSLLKLVEKNGYDAITFLLYGDLKTIYERGKNRNKKPGRHKGHLLNCYHKSDTNPLPELKQSFESFKEECESKDYDIKIGKTIHISVDSIDQIDLSEIFESLKTKINTDS